MKINSLRCKNHVKVLLKYLISRRSKPKKNYFNCKIGYRTYKILTQNDLAITMEGTLAKLN